MDRKSAAGLPRASRVLKKVSDGIVRVGKGGSARNEEDCAEKMERRLELL